MISVIVPVYNKQEIVGKCIEALRAQSYEDFECILVDDGSSDSSLSICNEASERDKRFKVIHKENGGLSSARNAGVDVASGDFLTFVDADDFVSNSYLKCLHDIQVNTGADVVCSRLRVVRRPGAPTGAEGSSSVKLLDAREALESLLYGKEIEVSACAKLYRSQLAKAIRFPVGKLYEDVCYSCEILLNSNSVAVTNDANYFYVMDSESITHNIDERVFDRYYLARSAKEKVDALGDPLLCRAASSYCVHHALAVLRCHYPNTLETRVGEVEALKTVAVLRKELESDGRVSLIDRCALLALRFGLKPYRLAWSVFEALTGR